MSAVDTAAELRRLAHSLGVAQSRLTMLGGVPPHDLRRLREQIGEALFQADRPAFARVAALSRAVPGAVVGRLSELALPPLLAARTAELLEPHRAADLVGRISDGYLADVAARTAELLEPHRAADLVGRISDSYLADVAAAMDASRCPDLVAAIPPERIALVGVELARRGEWVIIGGLVTHLPHAALRASIAALDGEQLLRICFVLDDASRLDEIGEMLTDAQRDQMITSAADVDLWDELTELLDHLQPARFQRMAQRFAAAGADVRAAYRAAADRGAVDSSVLARLGGQ